MNKITLFCAPLLLGACTVAGGEGQHVQEWQSYGLGGAERVVIATGNASALSLNGEKVSATAGKDGALLLNGAPLWRGDISGEVKLPKPQVRFNNGLYTVENADGLAQLFVWDKGELKKLALSGGEQRPENAESDALRARLDGRNLGENGPVLVGLLKQAPAAAVTIAPKPKTHELGSLLFFAPIMTATEEKPLQEDLLDAIRATAPEPAASVQNVNVLTSGGHLPRVSKTFAVGAVDKLQLLESVGLGANAKRLQGGGPLVFISGPRFPTGGHSIEVMGAELQGQKAIVTVRVNEPAANAMVTQAFTTPWTLLELKGDLAKATSVEVRGLGTTKGRGEVLNDR